MPARMTTAKPGRPRRVGVKYPSSNPNNQEYDVDYISQMHSHIFSKRYYLFRLTGRGYATVRHGRRRRTGRISHTRCSAKSLARRDGQRGTRDPFSKIARAILLNVHRYQMCRHCFQHALSLTIIHCKGFELSIQEAAYGRRKLRHL